MNIPIIFFENPSEMLKISTDLIINEDVKRSQFIGCGVNVQKLTAYKKFR